MCRPFPYHSVFLYKMLVEGKRKVVLQQNLVMHLARSSRSLFVRPWMNFPSFSSDGQGCPASRAGRASVFITRLPWLSRSRLHSTQSPRSDFPGLPVKLAQDFRVSPPVVSRLYRPCYVPYNIRRGLSSFSRGVRDWAPGLESGFCIHCASKRRFVLIYRRFCDSLAHFTRQLMFLRVFSERSMARVSGVLTRPDSSMSKFCNAIEKEKNDSSVHEYSISLLVR